MTLTLSYHWRNLFVRKTTTALTVLVIAAVVGTFTWLLGFVVALSDSLAVAADPRKVIVMQRGSISETNSALPPEDFNKLMQISEVASDGQPLISPEMMVQVSLARVRDGGTTQANVAVRGVTEAAFKVHRNVKLLGAAFSTGAPEIIVGRKAAQQFQGLQIGQSIRLGFSGTREYKVVGYFSAAGGPMESEIWGYLPSLQSAYGRTVYSAASLRLADGADAAAVVKQIDGPAIQLEAMTESEYWQNQSSNVRFYQAVCYVLVGMMSLAAVFSVANTMFSTVAGRTREIAMLRTIGFSPGQVRLGFVIESVLLSLVGGAIGCAGCAAYLAIMGNTKDMFGASNFTTIAFEIHLTPLIIAGAMLMVAIVGVLGSLAPASRAARIQAIAALREP
ncbi:Macrolide export ATP-binding/permease protein MacB [Phycisphaerae bacterium RAS1]|nr:Macrolide export ATP-binding/permease protein MacB [Phycisphaerae bacterium RAS1]